jgi:hypothetical protein
VHRRPSGGDYAKREQHAGGTVTRTG